MGRHLFAAALGLAFLAAGCISWMSAEPQPDGSAVICARVEPTQIPDAGADAATSSTASPAPSLQYRLVHAPVGTVAPAAPRSP